MSDRQLWMEEWNAKQRASNERVELWDFGAGVAKMPIPADTLDTNTYKVSQTCYLYIPGYGLPDGLGTLAEQKYVLGVDTKNFTSRDEVFATLDNAKEKLLNEFIA